MGAQGGNQRIVEAGDGLFFHAQGLDCNSSEGAVFIFANAFNLSSDQFADIIIPGGGFNGNHNSGIISLAARQR